MLPKALEQLARDVEFEREASSRLRKSLGITEKAFSRAHQLELITRVLDHACSSHSEAAESAGRIALGSLRTLAPFLKKKSTCSIDTIASIEKYAVNFALSSCSRRDKLSSPSSREGELVTSLKIICSARMDGKKGRKVDNAPTRKRKAKPNHDKENDDPDQQVRRNVDYKLIDLLFFPSAAELEVDMLLPNQDSIEVASTVTGALAIRFTRCCLGLPLKDMLMLAETFVFPWLNYLQSFSDEKSQRTYDAYAKRMSCFLFDQCKMQQQDPATVLSTRLFALQLEHPKLNKFARDLLQSVNNFSRCYNQQRRRSKHFHDAVCSVYRNALQYVTKYDSSDRRWILEDVSAWLDNVALFWARTNPSKSIPSVFSLRLSTFRTQKELKALLQCFKLQKDLFDAGAYQLDAEGFDEQKTIRCNFALWKKIALLLNSLDLEDLLDSEERSLFSAQAAEFRDDWKAANADGLRGLRLVRILEPVRRYIAAAFPDSSLPSGAEKVLRIYMTALFRGLSVLSWPDINSRAEGASEISDVALRLNKMVGGGIEAARDLIRFYSHQHQFEALEDVTFVAAKLLETHRKHSPCASVSWKEWLYSVLTSTCRKVLAEFKITDAKEDILVSRLYQTLMLCAEQMLTFAGDTDEISKGYINLLSMLRDVMLCRRWWPEAAEVSLCMFEQVIKPTSEEQHLTVKGEVSRMISQDIVRLTRNGDDLTFLEDVTIPGDMILSAFIEYSFWARKHRDSFKTTSKYLKTIDALMLMRKSVFQLCDMTGLLCPVRRAHEEWLAFDRSVTPRTGGKKKKLWKSLKPKRCSGHYPVHLHPQAAHVSCTTLHKQFLDDLKNVCEATTVRAFDRTSEFLNVLETALNSNRLLTSHVELMILSVEVFEWISTVLAHNSFGSLAHRALNLAHECCSFYDASLSLRESIKVCWLLDSLPATGLFEGDETINWKFRQTSESQSQSRNPCTLHEATSDLKSSLKALSKFDIGCEEGLSQIFSVGGLAVDLGFDNNSMSGHHRHGLILELIQYTFRLGIAQLQIENVSEARYYLELCWHIASACFPTKNNSLRRIASLSRAKCMTKKKASAVIQDSILKQIPDDKEDVEDGRNLFSTLSTLQTTAGAMLYVEKAGCLESTSSAVTTCAHADLIIALYDRCERMLETEKHTSTLLHNLNIERSRLQLNLGLTYLLKGEESVVLKLMKSLSGTDIQDGEIRASACYELAKLYIRRGSGLRSCVEKSAPQLLSHNAPPLTRGRRARGRRADFKQSRTSIDEIIAVLAHATQCLVPCLGSFPLYRKVWKLAAMVENEPEVMAWRLETAIGLSFNARYEHNMRCKLEHRAGKPQMKSTADVIGDVQKDLQKISLGSVKKLEVPNCTATIAAKIVNTKCVFVGIHIDEGKNSLVIWRRCARGFHLRRSWLPLSGSHSYHGVLQRTESILNQMKRSSYREGEKWSNAEKATWWEERHSLDKKMRKVLMDIQEVWLGPAINLLIPSVSSGPEIAKADQSAAFENYVEQGERARNSSDEGVAFGQLVLLVDTLCERIPWESLPVLHENEISATRTPSSSFLAAMWNSEKYCDYESMFYILNPEGNLGKTEDRFRDRLESQSKWSGIVGKTSSAEVFSSYDGEEVFLFCGHGAGENFFPLARACARTKAPIALLMGCSSCKPQDIEVGDFESNGPAIDFLAHGSPAVVGNLWDVSDGEIDRLTNSMLSLWLGDDEDELGAVSLADAVARSRSKCRLPYLVGAACIVMGAPHVYVQRNAEK